jgi:hypothetical protein
VKRSPVLRTVWRAILPTVWRAACVVAVTLPLAQAQLAPQAPPQIMLPERLPAPCVQSAANDFGLPATILLAMVKVESNGHSRVAANANGTWDVGVAQHNTASWVPYFEQRYGITAQQLAHNPCQSIRAQAYVLRQETNSRECAGVDLWCGVGRYHAPRNLQARQRYVAKVQAALEKMLRTGHFETASANRPSDLASR